MAFCDSEGRHGMAIERECEQASKREIVMFRIVECETGCGWVTNALLNDVACVVKPSFPMSNTETNSPNRSIRTNML
jgi:hypothetical protein